MAATQSSHLLIEPLGSQHDRAAFSCGVETLDHYLQKQAGQDVRKHVTTTFVLIEGKSPAVLGFYTLSATSFELEDLPQAASKKLPRYPVVPAILLGRLAVDRRQRGRRLGELLLLDAFKRCLGVADIGWAALVVDAKDDSAVAFYERFEFIRFSPKSQRLFLLRKTIASLFAGE